MLAIITRNLITPQNCRPGLVMIEDEKIIGILLDIDPDDPSSWAGRLPEICDVENVGDSVVSPGLVDTHVHINEPGRTEWEGFETATHAAAAGGITTLVDMPLNCLPVTTSAQNFEMKLNSVSHKLFVDCGFWGGATPDSVQDLDELLQSGVLGVKSFLIDSGIPEFQPMTYEDLLKVGPIVARHGLPYLIHAELDQGEAASVVPGASYHMFLQSRPRSWENNAIYRMIDYAREFKCHVHIVHLSSSEALEAIRKAKREGIKITTETCPHYLVLSSEEIASGRTEFKCCPPIREKENQNKLWQGLKDETIDFICSDHSPCTVKLKTQFEGDFGRAWGGISSLQFSLPLIWSEAQSRGFTLQDVAMWLSQRPAEMCGLGQIKGQIALGYDADLIVWNPHKVFRIDKKLIRYRNKMTPYEGREVRGYVEKTYLRGQLIYEHGHYQGTARGKALLNNDGIRS